MKLKTQTGEPGSRAAEVFQPFEHTFVCPECNRPLQLYVQPIHLTANMNCPRCSRPLTMMIRRVIGERIAS